MPRSADPERAGGKFVVHWVDYQGKTHSLIRDTRGKARTLMQEKRKLGMKSWITPK